MKHNVYYQQCLTIVNSDIDPSPSTVEGTRALVEKYYALKRMFESESSNMNRE